MLTASQFFIRHCINMFVAFATIILTALYFDWAIFVLVLPVLFYWGSNKITKTIQTNQRSKELGLTIAEMKLVQEQLKIARQNIQKLNQIPMKVRSIKSFKQKSDMVKISRRIMQIVQANPYKFFAIEDFFYAHLPSAVQLAEKYSMLTRQQVKGSDIHLALDETRSTMKELHVTLEDDLKLALKDEIESLKIELDFAKLENERRKERNELGGDL